MLPNIFSSNKNNNISDQRPLLTLNSSSIGSSIDDENSSSTPESEHKYPLTTSEQLEDYLEDLYPQIKTRSNAGKRNVYEFKDLEIQFVEQVFNAVENHDLSKADAKKLLNLKDSAFNQRYKYWLENHKVKEVTGDRRWLSDKAREKIILEIEKRTRENVGFRKDQWKAFVLQKVEEDMRDRGFCDAQIRSAIPCDRYIDDLRQKLLPVQTTSNFIATYNRQGRTNDIMKHLAAAATIASVMNDGKTWVGPNAVLNIDATSVTIHGKAVFPKHKMFSGPQTKGIISATNKCMKPLPGSSSGIPNQDNLKEKSMQCENKR